MSTQCTRIWYTLIQLRVHNIRREPNSTATHMQKFAACIATVWRGRTVTNEQPSWIDRLFDKDGIVRTSIAAQYIIHTVRCRYNAVNFITYIHKKTPHGSPVRARYGVSFVDSASDWYYVSVPAIINAKSYHIGPRHNGTRLYMQIELGIDRRTEHCPFGIVYK